MCEAKRQSLLLTKALEKAAPEVASSAAKLAAMAFNGYAAILTMDWKEAQGKNTY